MSPVDVDTKTEIKKGDILVDPREDSKIFIAETLDLESTNRVIMQGIALTAGVEGAPADFIIQSVSVYHRMTFLQDIDQCVGSKGFSGLYQLNISREKRWVYVSSSDVEQKNNNKRTIVIADVTDELREAQNHGHVHHEIRSYLTHMSLQSQLGKRMIDKYISNGQATLTDLEKINELMGAIVTTSNRLTEYIGTVFGRAENESQVKLHDLLEDLRLKYSVTDNLDKKRIEFSLNLNTPEIIIEGQETVALRQSIDNLIRNVLDHNPTGQLRISVATGVVPNGESYYILVADSGKGIDEESLPHIFEEEFKGKDSKGSGIGLSYVKRTIESMRGRIDVRSIKGMTCFVIIIPLAKKVDLPIKPQ